MRASYSGITSDFQSDDRSSILRPRSTNEYKEHGGELGSTGWWRMIWLPDDTVQGIAKNEQTTNANDYELAMAA